MTKNTQKKVRISIPELAEKIKGHVKVPNGLDLNKMDEFLSSLAKVCSQKKGTPETEIAKKEKEIGSLTAEQVKYITDKYASVIQIDDKHANALNLFGYGVTNVRTAVAIITAKE